MGNSSGTPDSIDIEESFFTPDSGWDALFVDGEWQAPGDRETVAVENPATQQPLCTVRNGTTDDIDAAFSAATEAQREWADNPPQERVDLIDDVLDVIQDHVGSILDILVAETGSTQLKSRIELASARGMIKEARSLPFHAKGTTDESVVPGKENRVRREPVGTVGVISPWNFPFHLSMRAVAPALALGNAVVLKPAPEATISSGLLVARVFEEAGLPDGLLNVVPGPGPEVGGRIAEHPDANVVAFTGSREVGKQVAKTTAERLGTPLMELGGNNPYIVTENADIDTAIDAAVYGTYLHQGQVCISINRHLVHQSLYDEYVEALSQRADELTVGDPIDRNVDIGPIINDAQYDQIATFIEESVESGATVETGGPADGRYIEPTVLSDISNDMPLACNEHFGPVAPVIPYETDYEAIELANATEYGLSAAIQSQDLQQAEALAEQIDAGGVHINDMPLNEEPHIPFGGVKQSGLGRFHGDQSVEVFTETKWISVQREERRYPL